ncbi:histidine kinase [Rhodoblastus sp.]|jgi:signal transduction histidine kinase|uniref:sensor histidine kinase n=1 Tax=Rhodoblastus sp. TaxID=1962975 RepID=UPI0025CF5214|nr:histidine kinase [Rhodoblastus sp.]
MPLLTKIDLKLRLALRVAALSAFCLVAAFAFLLFDGDRTARAQLRAVAEVVAKDLTLQLGQAHWVRPARDAFPDLQRIAASVMSPGLCISYRDEAGEVRQSFCGGSASQKAPAPFDWLCRRLFDPGAEISQPISFEGRPMGAAGAAFEPSSQIAAMWRETTRFLALMAATMSVLCLLVYAALARALRPTRMIQTGLERLAAGDLAARLPAFDLAELSAIRAVFNGLAEKLETTLAERRELTRRLIVVQDEERRRLARDLHDEFGQCLAAIGAVAASIGQTARAECPALVPESDSIARTTAHMMESLRSALTRLRPPELDEIGLTASLDRLVAGWNRRGGATRFAFVATESLDELPPFLCANLYRVAQEAMTNAAKHAGARNVELRLAWRQTEGGATALEMSVTDDGGADLDSLSAGPGLGLVGIRERVAALDGRLTFEPGAPTGLILRVSIPAPARDPTASRVGSVS